MQKNMAAVLAIGVLAVAILLMVFFVVPNWESPNAPIAQDTPASETTTTPSAATTTDAAATPPAGDAAATTTKTDRPGADAASDVAKPADSASGSTTAPAPTASETAKPADATPAASTAAETAATSGAATPTASPEAAAGTPTFDVLRVEPDGATVIAGRAAPNTTIRILSGDKVLATADAGPSGEFVAILNEPLAPGDYQLVIAATDKAGKESRSDEVATVSVPAEDKSKLLAMVSRPGEASRLITTPEAGAAKAVPSATSAATTTAEATQAPAAGAAQSADASQSSTPASGQTAAPTATAPAAAGNEPAALQVAAVEIEGDRLFVAGKAKPGATVRVYADDQLVGSAPADETGNFVVDGRIALSVGNHTIRADMLSPDGAKVELRAAVPFDRPEGDQVAAVAGASQTPGAAMAPLAGGSFDGLRSQVTKAFGLLKGLFANGATPNVEELAAARSATEIALGSLADFKTADTANPEGQALIARSAKAAAEALAKLRALPQDAAAVAAGLPSIEQAIAAVLAPNSGEPTPQTAAPAVSQSATPSTTQAQTGGSTAAQSAPAAGATATAPAGATATPPASAETATAPATAGGQAAATGAEPQTIQQAPLQQSKSSVIIRRGDTLWQISRRVYGAGVRYTTIYLANKAQIEDPDRILPGQVFGVPDKSLPDAEAEEIHREHIRK
ncbi:LysM peptidoglycan-binding domain-containing protein [Rhizobium sp. SG2393]|uniref:LysM peptidoglycan-binding domain-containing protein n=1 Tax=Rhizobium sp. SG2393 TaxID=3276279 RepID=UPI00366AD8D0